MSGCKIVLVAGQSNGTVSLPNFVTLHHARTLSQRTSNIGGEVPFLENFQVAEQAAVHLKCV